MSLINFDGKLFGKVNIVDLVIVLILIFGLIFAGRLIYNLAEPDEKWIVIDVRFDKVPHEVANSVKVGYVEKIADKIVAEVMDTQLLPSSDVFTKSILLKVKLLTKIENNQLVHNQNLLVGAYRSLTLGPAESEYATVYLYNGLILSIDVGLNNNKTEKIVEMRMYNDFPWIADAIKIGNKEINYQNETLAEVISKEVQPAQFVFVSEETGEVSVKENPLRKDIILKVKLYGKTEDNEVFIFKENRIMIGKWVSLELDHSLFLNGVITKIE